MKKTSKILLLALAISSMCFTMTVNAEELTSNESQNIPVVQATTITQTQFDSIIPNEIELTTTMTDVANYNIDENYDGADPNEELVEKLISILGDNGYTFSSSELRAGIDFYDWKIGGVSIDSQNVFKEFTIKYAKESNYSEQDATSVKNKLDSIEFAKYGDDDAVYTVYNLGDYENFSNFDINVYDFDKLFNDSSITIKKTMLGGVGSGVVVNYGTTLYIYKNDVLYETKYISNVAVYGTTLENGTPVSMLALANDNETYKEMAKELESKGYTNILGCYELEAYGTTYDNMKVSFTLGNDYNGKEVQILHKKNDGSYETFTTIVADGKATISVNEFSPFMLALSGNGTTTENVNNAPNNAQTGSLNVVFYGVLALGSLVGITYILVSRKKKEIA